MSETPLNEPQPGSDAIVEHEPQPRELPASPSPSAIRQIFLGPNGIRAGWRLLIFVVLLRFLIPGAQYLVDALMPRGARSNGGEITITPRLLVQGASLFLAVLLAAFLMSKIEGRPIRAYGLSGRGAFGRHFWFGALTGFVALTVLLLAIFALGDFSFGRVVLPPLDIARFGGLWGAMFLIVGFSEEYLIRGYPLFTLSTGIGFWPAAVLLSIVFAMLHYGNSHENWLGLFEIVPIAIFFCLTVRRTGSLWFAIGYHAAWDWGQSFFYGVPDSGNMAHGHLLNASFQGSAWITGAGAGPEGSALLLPLTVVMMWLFHRAYPASKYPDPEMVRQWRRLPG
jgi:membrane protease YdiL (CAAX protease family)